MNEWGPQESRPVNGNPATVEQIRLVAEHASSALPKTDRRPGLSILPQAVCGFRIFPLIGLEESVKVLGAAVKIEEDFIPGMFAIKNTKFHGNQLFVPAGNGQITTKR